MELWWHIQSYQYWLSIWNDKFQRLVHTEVQVKEYLQYHLKHIERLQK